MSRMIIKTILMNFFDVKRCKNIKKSIFLSILWVSGAFETNYFFLYLSIIFSHSELSVRKMWKNPKFPNFHTKKLLLERVRRVRFFYQCWKSKALTFGNFWQKGYENHTCPLGCRRRNFFEIFCILKTRCGVPYGGCKNHKKVASPAA